MSKIGPSGAVQTVSDSPRPLFLVIGPSGAVQTVSDSRRPLFLVINLLFVLVVVGDVAQTL